MSEHVDLRPLLAGWPYDPENDARLARGADGREILQVRQPLGLEQYELDGRPDGLRPRDRESVLAWHLERFAAAQAGGTAASFTLSPAECAELFNEGTLYYYRYLRCFQLKDWRRTARDTERNLKLFDFVHQHAEREEDQQHLEKWRPYLLRMNGIARAMIELDDQDYARAIAIVADVARKIDALPEMADETFKFERQRSLLALRELAVQIEQTRPLTEIERLEKQLRRAVEAQEFERAAQLRDRLRGLRHQAEKE